jgi:putative ABC transport system permease protein
MNRLLQHLLQFLSQLGRRLLSVLRRGRYEREMEEEMRFHLEMQIEQNLDAGVAAKEASYAARRQFGNQTWLKEASREMWRLNSIETLIQDLRYGARMLLKKPGFTLIAIFTLALGIGATTAIFSVVEGVLLKPLPYHQPEELVAVRFTVQNPPSNEQTISNAAYFIFREQNQTFQDIGLYTFSASFFSVNVTGLGEPEHAPTLRVTDGLLPILGVTPLLGRSFTREDDSPNSAETVILTYGYWSRKFGGDRSVIGRTIELDGKPHTIIGVLPEGFRFLDQTNLAMLLPRKLNRGQSYLNQFHNGGIARLKPGVTLAQANADVARMIPIADRSSSLAPGSSLKAYEDMRLGPGLRPLKQDVVGDVGKVLWVLMGGISLVWVIACANLANLLLLRAEGRRQELAIRAALGASRGRIAAQLFFESLILAVCGGLLGLGLAYGAVRVLVALAPEGLPRLHEIGIDGNVVQFTLAMSLAAGLLFGSFPVFKYAGASLGIGLRAGERSMSESRERHRARGILVIIQVALALVLLVSSGLMIRTFRALTSVNPGFVAPAEVQTFRIGISNTQVKDPERVVRIEEEILRKIAAIPGVSSVGLSGNVPMGNGIGFSSNVFANDSAFSPVDLPLRSLFWFVAPGYFKTLGMPLVAGRDITWSDIYNKVPVVIVSEKFARTYLRDPAIALGKQIRTSQKDDRLDWREVIGVVADARYDGVDKESPATVYMPILVANFQGRPEVREFLLRNVTLSIRSPRGGSEGLMNEIRRAVWSVAPNLPLTDVNTLNDYYTRSMARYSFTLVMLAVAGSMALFLGIVGLYGVIAYSVSQRRREIGIRMALGAQESDVLWMVIWRGMSLALIGMALGLATAFALTRVMKNMLYEVSATDPATFALISLLLIGVALIASYIPARRAIKVDPLQALRQE